MCRNHSFLHTGRRRRWVNCLSSWLPLITINLVFAMFITMPDVPQKFFRTLILAAAFSRVVANRMVSSIRSKQCTQPRKSSKPHIAFIPLTRSFMYNVKRNPLVGLPSLTQTNCSSNGCRAQYHLRISVQAEGEEEGEEY